MAAEWTQVRIGDIAHRVTKGTTPTTMGGRFTNAGIAFVKVESITDDGRFDAEKTAFIDEETNRLLARSTLQEDDILFTIAGTIGRVARVDCGILPANTNQAVAIVRPNRDMIDPRFLYYALRDDERIRLARTRVVQSVQANFSLAELSGIEVPLPQLAEQRAIAHILGTLDDKIELNRKMNATLDEIARTLFTSWFVNFDPVRAKAEGRQPEGMDAETAALFPDRFVDSELGPIPEGWKVKALSDFTDINSWSLGRNEMLDPVKYIEISEVKKGDVGSITNYARGTEPSRARRRLRHGDTVLSTVRPDRGAYFLCLDPDPNLIASTGFAVITPRDVAWSFVYEVATQPRVFRHFGLLADGGAYPAIRFDVVGALQVAMPPAPLILNRFAQVAEPLLERANANRVESRTLADIHNELLPELLSGRIRALVPAQRVGAV